MKGNRTKRSKEHLLAMSIGREKKFNSLSITKECLVCRKEMRLCRSLSKTKFCSNKCRATDWAKNIRPNIKSGKHLKFL